MCSLQHDEDGLPVDAVGEDLWHAVPFILEDAQAFQAFTGLRLLGKRQARLGFEIDLARGDPAVRVGLGTLGVLGIDAGQFLDPGNIIGRESRSTVVQRLPDEFQQPSRFLRRIDVALALVIPRILQRGPPRGQRPFGDLLVDPLVAHGTLPSNRRTPFTCPVLPAPWPPKCAARSRRVSRGMLFHAGECL